MLFDRLTGARSLTAAVVVTGTCILRVLAADPQRSERIDFSGGGKEVLLPESSGENSALERRLESLDKGSFGGVVEVPGMPAPPSRSGYQINPRLLEALGRKLDAEKNWIYAKPGDSFSWSSVEQTFGVWDRSATPADRMGDPAGRSGVVADFFHDKVGISGRSQSARTTRFELETPAAAMPLDISKPGLSSISPQGFGSLARGQFGVTGAGRAANPVGSLLAPEGVQPAPDPSAGSLRPLVPNITPALPRGGDGPKTIRELVGQGGVGSPLARRLDPINTQPDETRQELNPVMPRRLDDLSFLPSLTPPDLFGSTKAGSSSQPNPLHEMTVKMLGPSSLSPTIPAALEAPKVKPKTSVLELPARKF
jgi:hypothetical protein